MEEAMILFLLLLFSLNIQSIFAVELTAISASKFLTEGDTLVSPAGLLELGFFRPGTSENKYVGIWYKKIPIQTVVWVANRNNPLSGDSTGTLKIVKTGNLVLVNETNDVVWSTNMTSSAVNAIATANLDDFGNLIVRDETKNTILWESFDFPTDTLLPGMKFGRNFVTGKEWGLTPWKSSQDPAPGDYTWTVDTRGYPQNLLKQTGSIKFRGGPWNGLRFSGASGFGNSMIFTTDFVINKREVAFTYYLQNTSVESRFVLNSSGLLERYVWVAEGNKWQLILQLPKDICDRYNICNAYGSCSILTSQTCACFDNEKFVPRNKKGWEIADWSGGCVRRTPLDCENGSDGFIKYSRVKLPDTKNSWFDMSLSLNECEARCLKNCSCMAYANTNISGSGSGCLIFFNELVDIRVYSEGNGGQDLFVRMASSELASQTVKGRTKIRTIIAAVFLGVVICLTAAGFWYICRKWHHIQKKKERELSHVSENHGEGMELPLFNFAMISKATHNFSPENKLGEGGFGPVYKGVLEEGQEVAVKRLSKTSSQGLDEFKNEVICISKLQHRNLVRLLGCSIDGDEKLLVYEYMPNRSLDWFIFDKTRSALLDWTMRFNIIKGIARGLLYLHQDSRLRIIHRDLKASNILLDLEMYPKISDFGIARSFGGNETQANTERVVGTYGYMSPEYALDGIFSIKSDVFSFGVLVLEIVSGKRNRGFIHPDHDNNLIGHAWRLHNEGKTMELVDAVLSEPSDPSEVIRSVQLALLCVQQSPDDRPEMSSVVLMLSNEGAMLKPKQPAFFTERNYLGPDFSSSTYPTSSTNDVTVTNDVTITEIVAR